MVTGREHVAERQQVGDERVVDRLGHAHQGAVGERHADELGLGAVVAAAVDARGLHTLAADRAGVVAVQERGDDELAHGHVGHRRAHLLDHADELVPDTTRLRLVAVRTAVGPEVAATHAGSHDADHRVGVVLHDRVGHGVETDVARAVEDGRTHTSFLPVRGWACCWPSRVVRPSGASVWAVVTLLVRCRGSRWVWSPKGPRPGGWRARRLGFSGCGAGGTQESAFVR
jgi:hypothetical protein